MAYNTPGMMETNWSVQEEESSPIGLNLELGRGSCQKLDNKRFHGFTILQLHELQLQALIFKYIEAGLPVPYHLVLPIWQSFSTTLGSLNNGLLPYFPNCKYTPRNISLPFCPIGICSFCKILIWVSFVFFGKCTLSSRSWSCVFGFKERDGH